MRVVHINSTDMVGGAALAMSRLHAELCSQGVDSKLLVGERFSDDPRVVSMPRHSVPELAWGLLARKFGYNDEGCRYSFRLRDHPLIREAEVVHLNNVHGNYLLYRALPRILAGKAVVWTLHDMWALTGHCAHSFECVRWRTGCGQCPNMQTYPAVSRDTTAHVWRLRHRAYDRLARGARVRVVCPSQWLGGLAREGLPQFPVDVVPYGLDTQIYQPRDRVAARAALGLPADKFVLLCVAASLTSEYKGMDLFVDALRKLPHKYIDRVVVAALGRQSESLVRSVPVKVVPIGYTEDDAVKSLLYSAADLFVQPSRADNLPLVLQESMACGTPMVSFNVGGIPDLVRDGETGLLAPRLDTTGLHDQIVRLIEDPALRSAMSQKCRQIAVQEYDIRDCARRHIQMYEQLMGAGGPAAR